MTLVGALMDDELSKPNMDEKEPLIQKTLMASANEHIPETDDSVSEIVDPMPESSSENAKHNILDDDKRTVISEKERVVNKLEYYRILRKTNNLNGLFQHRIDVWKDAKVWDIFMNILLMCQGLYGIVPLIANANKGKEVRGNFIYKPNNLIVYIYFRIKRKATNQGISILLTILTILMIFPVLFFIMGYYSAHKNCLRVCRIMNSLTDEMKNKGLGQHMNKEIIEMQVNPMVTIAQSYLIGAIHVSVNDLLNTHDLVSSAQIFVSYNSAVNNQRNKANLKANLN